MRGEIGVVIVDLKREKRGQVEKGGGKNRDRQGNVEAMCSELGPFLSRGKVGGHIWRIWLK